MKIYTIYKITNNITEKSYIGFTKDFSSRISRHKSAAKNSKSKNKLHLAIRIYGWHNFSVDILYQSKDHEYTLNTMEQFFIEEYNSINSGYNTAKGGGAIYQKNSSNNFVFISPEKITYKTNNFREFCREHNLDKRHMGKVAKGERNHHKSWKVYGLSEKYKKINPIDENLLIS